MKDYHHVNYYTKRKFYFQYIKKISWLHVLFLTRSRELSTLPCLHLANFVKSQGPFFDTPPMKDLDLLPHECWYLIGAGGRTSAPIAHHILAQVCFASSCTQNWN